MNYARWFVNTEPYLPVWENVRAIVARPQRTGTIADSWHRNNRLSILRHVSGQINIYCLPEKRVDWEPALELLINRPLFGAYVPLFNYRNQVLQWKN